MKTNVDTPEPADNDAEPLVESRHFELDELGIPLLHRDKDDLVVVTNEFIYQLRELEGV